MVTVLGHIDAWTDGIPCYGSIKLFSDRQKAEAWLESEYGKDYKEEFVPDEEIEKDELDCTFNGPEGWQIWEAVIR